MTLKIHYFDGIPFVATPYQQGVFIRQDVFRRQFRVFCAGIVEYPEDDPTDGPYTTGDFRDLGTAGLIIEAMSLAQQAVVLPGSLFSPGSNVLIFRPEQFTIQDRFKRLVLSGTVRGQSISWCPPVASDKEAELAQRIAHLYSEAAIESGWDNYETARGLRQAAAQLKGQLVHPFWRQHAIEAITAAQ